MKIHVTAHIPSIKNPVAGQKISALFLRNESLKDVILIAFYNRSEIEYLDQELLDLFHSYYLFEIKKINRVINFFLYPTYPSKVTGRFSKKILRHIIKIVKSNKCTKITFEFTSVFLYASILKTRLNPEVILIAHDINFQAMLRLSNSNSIFKRIFYYLEYWKSKLFEINLFKRKLEIHVLNIKDKKLLIEQNIKKSKIVVKKPILESWIYKINRSNVSENTILFMGALNRFENVNGIIWFIENVFHDLVKKNESLKLLIVGKFPPKSILKFSDKNILILGYVKDLKKIFETVTISVCPLFYGAGIKIKVLETIAAKIPTICSDIGAEGVGENTYLHIANSKLEFTDKVKELLKF